MNLKAWKTIEKHHMMEQGGAVLAGVSGGADSVALLHLLCSLRGPLGIRVYAAHINHMIRGAEALRDEQYVEKICREWGVELFVIRADVRREAAESGESLEEAGRRIRYDYFEKKSL
ncbi:MAG TPA: ATP-binding protein [Clostridia bacterium]|nr:ATP-binding protein [Clostridia bacterium]